MVASEGVGEVMQDGKPGQSEQPSPQLHPPPPQQQQEKGMAAKAGGAVGSPMPSMGTQQNGLI
uniref:Uncharacterized protein n=1 Tax=Sciurus vulgaris TaxID=55149 RepID=A0A8D2B7T3_SCIVU